MPPKPVPKLCRHRGRSQAYVRLNGRQVYLGPWVGPEPSPEAVRAYNRIVAELAAGVSPIDDGLTVAELALKHLDHCDGYYRRADGTPTGEVRVQQAAWRWVVALYADTDAKDFGPQQLRAVRQTMVDEGRARSYVNAVARRIVAAFKWAAAHGLVDETVWLKLKAVDGLRRGRSQARETEPVGPVADDVVERTLPHLSPVVAAMVRLQRLTGCRPGEVVAIRPCDVDRSSDVWLYRPESHKNTHRGQTRVIPLGPRAQEVLAPFLARTPEQYCFSPAESMAQYRAERTAARKTPASCGNKPGSNRKGKPKKQPGERYDARAYAHAVAAACRKAGVEHWSPNRLRHTAATELRKRHGLEAAQVILGHSRLETSQVYAAKAIAAAIEIARQSG